VKIRSITYFLNPGRPLDMAAIKQAGKFLAMARPMFEAAGYEVQSARLATIPFPDLLPECSAQAVTEFALALEAAAGEQGYTCAG
jgi:hypothetical protein